MPEQHSIEVNGEAVALPGDCTVNDLLGRLELQHSRVAVALNRSVVPRSRYGVVTVCNGDHVEILEAVGGG